MLHVVCGVWMWPGNVLLSLAKGKILVMIRTTPTAFNESLLMIFYVRWYNWNAGTLELCTLRLRECTREYARLLVLLYCAQCISCRLLVTSIYRSGCFFCEASIGYGCISEIVFLTDVQGKTRVVVKSMTEANWYNVISACCCRYFLVSTYVKLSFATYMSSCYCYWVIKV